MYMKTIEDFFLKLCNVMYTVMSSPGSPKVPLLLLQLLQVFEEFTVFASDYVAFVHACDRCRLLNWKWVECTYGILDQERIRLLNCKMMLISHNSQIK